MSWGKVEPAAFPQIKIALYKSLNLTRSLLWLISSATNTMVAVTLCSDDFCRNAVSEGAGRGIASSFQSTAMAIVNLYGWKCWIFTVSVYLIKHCCYHSVYMDMELAPSYFVVAACSSLKCSVNIVWSNFKIFFVGWKYFIYLKVRFGLLPINRKAEISHSFFSIHLWRTRQLTLGEIVVKSVLSRILPKFSSKEEKCKSEVFF